MAARKAPPLPGWRTGAGGVFSLDRAHDSVQSVAKSPYFATMQMSGAKPIRLSNIWRQRKVKKGGTVMRLLVLGASGGVGSNLLEQAIARGHRITAQTRNAGKLVEMAAVRVIVGSPTDEAFLKQHVAGHDAVILAIGIDSTRRTTLFSETTKAVIAAMKAVGVKRLVAITGIGAGNSKGHGGWLYNHVIYPLFTRNRYADKDRQEAMIEQTDLDWTIVRPAPFAARAGSGPWQVVTEIPEGLQLRSVTRTEVATFILDSIESDSFLRQKPFIGHS